MNKCPFWSTTKEKFECYRERPMYITEESIGEDDVCVFKECSLSTRIDFKEIIKDDYEFLNLSMYEEEKSSNRNY